MSDYIKHGCTNIIHGYTKIIWDSSKNFNQVSQGGALEHLPPHTFKNTLKEHLRRSNEKWHYYTLHYFISTFLDYTLDPFLPPMRLYNKFALQTVIIDPLITYYNNLLGTGTFYKIFKGEISLRTFLNEQCEAFKKEETRKALRNAFIMGLKCAVIGPFTSLVIADMLYFWKGLMLLSIITNMARAVVARSLLKSDVMKFLPGILLLGAIKGIVVGLAKMSLIHFGCTSNATFYGSKYILHALLPLIKPIEEQWNIDYFITRNFSAL